MTRRVVRLFVLLGVAVGVYFVLSLFDHAARADTGSIDRSGVTDPTASVKTVAESARTAIPETKPVTPKSITTKGHPQEFQRPTVKAAEVHPPKVQTPRVGALSKVQAPKVQAPKVQAPPKIQATGKVQAPGIRAGHAVRRMQARTPKLVQSTADSVRDVARATVTPAGKDVVGLKLPTRPRLPSLPDLSELPRLPRAEISALPQLPSWPQIRLSTVLRRPGLHQAPMTVLSQPSASANAPALHQPLMPPMSAQLCPLPQMPAVGPISGQSGVIKPPAAPTQPPLPAAPRQPTDFSTTTGQASDSGGGSAPSTGTVSSSWRPEVTAAGCRPATDVITRGRTVRYAGPPS